MSILAILPFIASHTKEWYQYLILVLTCMVKYQVGMIYAFADGFNFWEVWIFGTIGGVLGVILFAYFGNTIRVYYRKRRKERGKTKKQNMRRALRLGRFWMRYGIWGISVISPFISPMVAVFIALTFREKPNRIIRHIGLAIVISSFLIALIGEIRILWRI